jgi:outer membrane protein TolC
MPRFCYLWITILLSLVGCTGEILRDRVDRGVVFADTLADEELALAPSASRTLSGDVTISQLLSLARKNNATLMRAGYGALLARAQRDTAFAQVVLPRVSMQAAYQGRSNQPATRSNFAGMNFRIQTGQKKSFNFGGSLKQPIFSLADHIYRFNSARLLAKSAKLNFVSVWQEIRRSIVRTVFDIFDLQGRQEAVAALIKSLKKSESDFQSKLKVGMALKNDVYRVQAELANQEQALMELINAQASAQVLLNTLIGVEPEAQYRIVWDQVIPGNATAPSISEAFELALRNRPDLLGLEVNKEAQQQLVYTEWAGYVPRFDFNVDYQFSNADQLLEDDFFQYTMLASIDLLDFARHTRIDQAHARIGELTGQSLELERRVRVDIERGCRAVKNELSRLRQAARAAKASRENYRVLKVRYANDRAAYIDVLEAEFAKIRDRINRRSARYTYFQALADLDALVGVEGYFFKGYR